MNFLAHIYLSGKPSELMIGNFIADFIRGKQIEQFNDEIKRGIHLHRRIDTFTDSHVIIKSATNRLKPNYGRYASVIIDIIYDHFLAKNWMRYHNQSLLSFADDVYGFLDDNYEVLPPKVQTFLPYMRKNNWLVNYANMYGLRKSLEKTSQRAKYSNELSNAVRDLHEHYDLYEKEFHEFFGDIIDFVEVNEKSVRIAAC